MVLAATVTYLVYELVTVEPRYNAVVGVHDFGPHCKRGALGVLISATRELACSIVLYGNMQFTELIKRVLFLNVTPS